MIQLLSRTTRSLPLLPVVLRLSHQATHSRHARLIGYHTMAAGFEVIVLCGFIENGLRIVQYRKIIALEIIVTCRQQKDECGIWHLVSRIDSGVYVYRRVCFDTSDLVIPSSYYVGRRSVPTRYVGPCDGVSCGRVSAFE